MAALERIASEGRAVPASHIALKLVDRGGLGSADDIQRDGLVCIAAKAPNLQIAIPRVERVAESGPVL
jgi:hypothetical protein